jgi:hypothetical protein
VKRSLGVSELVPTGVVTVTGTEPVPGGAFTFRTFAFLLMKRMVAGVLPKSTAVTPRNPDPLIVTTVPPATGPVVGCSTVTVGLIEPDQGPVSLRGGRRDHVPDTEVPPTDVPLNVSPVSDAVTFHTPAHETVPTTNELTDSVTGDVKMTVMGPLTLKGTRREKAKSPDHVPCSSGTSDELHVPVQIPASGVETHAGVAALEAGMLSGPVVTARAPIRTNAPPRDDTF